MNTFAELYRYIKKLEDENTRLLVASRGMVETIAQQEIEIVRYKMEIERYRKLFLNGSEFFGPESLN